ncbi:MAG: FG-GAP-like repeat-containing protein [Myxococcota bacterium]
MLSIRGLLALTAGCTLSVTACSVDLNPPDCREDRDCPTGNVCQDRTCQAPSSPPPEGEVLTVSSSGGVFNARDGDQVRVTPARCPDVVRPVTTPSPGPALQRVELRPPRQLAPLSSTVVTGTRPTLRFLADVAATGVEVEICHDRRCECPAETVTATGSTLELPRDLPTGVVYWRLRALQGRAVGTMVSPTWQLVVGRHGAPRAVAVGSVTDVNADGHADVVVGAHGAADGAGQVQLFLGGASVLTGHADAVVLPHATGATGLGHAVAHAGDVNGDGFSDVLVTAPGEGRRGVVHLYLGNAAGLSTTPATTLRGPLDSSTRFAATVAGVGDVNGDGYGDVAVGSPGDARVFIHHGMPSGLQAAPATVLRGSSGTGFGAALAGLGDVNGDGYGDLAVGAPVSHAGRGMVLVHHGSVDGTDPRAATTLMGTTSESRLGTALSGAGDVNGDGYADLVVGAPGEESGRAYVQLGGATGVDARGWMLEGAPEELGFGMNVSGAGDVNADGFADVVVAIPESAQQPGRIHVFHGATTAPREPAARIRGQLGAGFGGALRGVGDTNGDGYSDVLVGAPQDAHGGRVYLMLGGPRGLDPSNVRVRSGDVGNSARFGSALALRDVTSQSALAQR